MTSCIDLSCPHTTIRTAIMHDVQAFGYKVHIDENKHLISRRTAKEADLFVRADCCVVAEGKQLSFCMRFDQAIEPNHAAWGVTGQL